MTAIDLYAPEAPAVPFAYFINTTAVYEHRRGIAWTADLYLGTVKVGTVEQGGNGGCDEVTLANPAYRLHWKSSVAAAFAGDEEAATYWMLCVEEGQF
jgi:hypothetical protein